MVDSNETNDILIKITHYINPQFFWYTNIKKYQKIANQLNELEIDLVQHCKINTPPANPSSTQHYEIGDMIILNYLPMNKCIRGRVLHVEMGNPNVYIVWAIDYGFPIESSCEHMFSLPQQFCKSLGHNAFGGIGYVVLDDNICHSNENSRFEKILMNAKSLHFAKMFESSTGQNFGYLFIFEESTSYNALEYLVNKRLGRLSTVGFESICTQLEATKGYPWRSMSGNMELNLAIKNASNVEGLKCKKINDILSRSSSMSTRQNLPTSHATPVTSVKSNLHLDLPKKSKSNDKQLNSTASEMFKRNIPNQDDKLAGNTNIVSRCGEQSLRVDYMDHLVVAHANVPIEPIDHFNNANFEANVWSSMKHNKFDKLYRIQRIAWPHLLRGTRSLILINQPKSGRTWSYLPVVCSRVVKQFKKNLKMNCGHIFGPMAIILVADIKNAQYVATACEMLLSQHASIKGKVVTAYSGKDRGSVRIQLHNGCGILITTLPQLKELFKHNATEVLFNPSKLLYLVIDDLDLIFTYYGTEFVGLFHDLVKVSNLKKSNHLKPQLVLTSQHWESKFMTHCLKIAREPLLLFGDFLEAAAYARVPLQMKIVDNNNKLQKVIDFLEKRECDGRTIIYCNDDRNILMLQRQLEKVNFECLSYLKTSSVDVRENINAWQHRQTNKILICSDDSPELKTVQNAKYLIHYTIADTWSKFTFRFSSIAKLFYNAVSSDVADDDDQKGKKSQAKPVVLVLLEEGDKRWQIRFKKFMEKHNIEVPEFLTTFFKENLENSEEKRSLKGWALCSVLATHGDCNEYGCIHRHILTNKDLVPDDQKDHIPVDGAIAMKVLKIYNPAHWSVIVLKHQDPHSQKWRKLPNNENFISLCFKLNMYFANEDSRQMHWPPIVHDICVIKVDGEFRRVRIMDVGYLQYTHIVQPDINVTLQVMDFNNDVMYRRAGHLFHCPLQFQIIPALAIEVRLLGLVPFDGERNWLPSATKIVSKQLESLKKTENNVLLGSIEFTMAHTIFLKNVRKVNYLATVDVYTNSFNLLKFLIKIELGKKDDVVVSKLRKMFSDINMTSDMESLNSLNDEKDNSVNKKLQDQKTIDNPKENSEIPMIMTSSNSNENTKQNENKMKSSSSKSNSQESWCTLPINELTQIEILNERDNGVWDGFYIIGIDPENVCDFNDILKLTNDYITEEKPNILTSMKHCKPGDNFIIEDDNNFKRAKLINEYESSNCDNLYKFLFVDSGNFVYVSASALNQNRRIYKSTHEIACSIPYQAIFCKFAGIIMRRNQRIFKATGKYLYVVPQRQCKSPLMDVKINAYEVVLFECDNDDDLTTGIMLNKHLIDLNIADYDDKTKADLDIHLKKTEDSLKQLQQCLNNVEDYEIDSAKDFVRQLLDDDEFKSTSKPDKNKDMVKLNNVKNADKSKLLPPNSQIAKPLITTTTYPTKCPQLVWHQNSGFIYINIEASEETDYTVFCNGSELFYATLPPNEPPAHLFHLYLCGYVEQITHEKLGLCVNIKLRKTDCGLWPSLFEIYENDPDYKLPFIKYNMDHLQIDSEELSHVQLTQLALNRIEAGLHETRPTDNDDMDSETINTDVDTVNNQELDLKEVITK